MAVRIVIAGEIYIDHVMAGFDSWPQPGQEVFASSLTREVGGGAPHTAAGLARLGHEVMLVGPVGNELWVRHRLEHLGVRTIDLRQHESEPTGMTVVVSMPHERAFLTYRGANIEADSALRNLPEADHLHIAAACDYELLGCLCKRHATVSIDAGWHLEWLRDSSIQQILRGVTWFLPNESEAAAITGESDPAAMLRRFDELGIRSAVKLGAAGSAALDQGQFVHVPSFAVQSIDTTGAGDCFNAGFLDAWLRGEDLASCLLNGNICGALSTRQMGGMNGFPAREELNEWRSKSR